MITADTITDEQIRELRSAVLYDQTPFEASSDREASEILHTCDVALYGLHSKAGRESPKFKARARCAEILNARACGFGVEGGECTSCESTRKAGDS